MLTIVTRNDPAKPTKWRVLVGLTLDEVNRLTDGETFVLDKAWEPMLVCPLRLSYGVYDPPYQLEVDGLKTETAEGPAYESGLAVTIGAEVVANIKEGNLS